MKIELIEWLDSYSRYGWIDREEALDMSCAHCCSIGLVIKEEEKSLTMVLSTNRKEYHDHNAITIPKGCITRRRVLKVR